MEMTELCVKSQLEWILVQRMPRKQLDCKNGYILEMEIETTN